MCQDKSNLLEFYADIMLRTFIRSVLHKGTVWLFFFEGRNGVEFRMKERRAEKGIPMKQLVR